ncbi:hypothetical protein QDT91_28675 (plasmid) [Mycolicibacterium aubagnense]|uniref:hypothetical protein n=1 Tax=Mycolicibacterium aubagnense TaxID=319707 RepID=UPI00244DAE2B|nr:hypothetical protein [Mycolicibacterium aubagnense]WGI35983.1 hypothetical protein QDT91_28675 [Mycolicibacterium aubagnense]
MLTGSINGLFESLLLRFSGNDPIRADDLRSRIIRIFVTLIAVTYVPLLAVVALMFVSTSGASDTADQVDEKTAVSDYAFRFVDAYLRNPSSSASLREFYDGDITATALPAGGRALNIARALPGLNNDGFRTWTVTIDAEFPKEARATNMVHIPLQVDIAVDRLNRFRAFTLPHLHRDRPPGQPVEIATQAAVSEDRPVYKTVKGFLNSYLVGQGPCRCQPGDTTPFIASGSTLKAPQNPDFVDMTVERVHANSDLAVAQDVPPKADGVEVTARVTVKTKSGVQLPMDFPLVMSVASGHWQVDQINDTPGFVPPSDSSTETTSEPTPTTPTTTLQPTPTTATTATSTTEPPTTTAAQPTTTEGNAQ